MSVNKIFRALTKVDNTVPLTVYDFVYFGYLIFFHKLMEAQNQILGVLSEEFVSSSSESESEPEDDDGRCIECNRIPRIQDYIETIVLRYNDQIFKETFRLQRSTFQYTLNLIRADLESYHGKMTIDPEKQLYVALHVLGTPDSYRSITIKFGVGKATAWRAVRRVVRALCKLRTYFIQWPNERECQETANRLEERFGFPGVIGAVDGTHINIAAPKVDHVSYINRKGVDSIQLQVVCNHKLEFIHCFAGLPRCVHDMRVFQYSGLQRRCQNENFPRNSHLIGDAAYTLQKHVMVLYRDNGHLTANQVYYNEVHSSTRMIVERAIGLLKGRWRYFLDKLPMTRTDLIPYYILAICVLHNICLKRQDDFEFPINIPDNDDVDGAPVAVPNQLKVHGNRKRERIMRRLNGLEE